MPTECRISESLLDDLCERLGIEPEFFDYQGERRTASPEVRRRLVEALGFELLGDDDTRLIAERLNREAWPEAVPPVAVLHADRDQAVELCVDCNMIDRPARWQVRCEHGETLDGEFVPADLEYLDKAEIDGRLLFRYRLRFPDELPLGYHRLHLWLAADTEPASYSGALIVAPRRCHCPDADSEDRMWGFSVQLYGVRSDRNWGMGDLTDLREFVERSARAGADFVGVNPLHALFPANPQHASPYSPSSRLYINYLYLDIEAVREYQECPAVREWVESAGIQRKLAMLRELEQVDYASVAELKLQALAHLYRRFVSNHLEQNTSRATDYRAFVEREGRWLTLQAAYDALFEENGRRTGEFTGWQQWPGAYHSPESQVVQRYIEEHGERIGFYQYLQWLCAQQLEQVQQAALDAGMRIGLYRDLAVGVQGGGAEAWSGQRSFSFQASIGAPPDPLALQGQDWGLPPLNPRGLQQTAYAVFIKLLQANMRHAGALRIDHVMALLRLWWIPEKRSATDGAYVYYPLDDLLGIVKLESHRRRCRIIGEDLGTVPEQIRVQLPGAGVYSYKVMYFEKHNGAFKDPRAYEGQAMTTVTTHDLPTLAGWWEGRDLVLRDDLSLFPTTSIREREYYARDEDRANLLNMMAENGYWRGSRQPEQIPETTMELSAAVHSQLAAGCSVLMAVQPEDLLLMRDPVNVPGTVDEYPNWRRKLSGTIAGLFASGSVQAVMTDIGRFRGRR